MANTICLSSDMNTLYIINSENDVSSFSLSGNGVDLTLSGGNLSGAAGRSAPSGTSLSLTNAQYSVEFISSVSKVAIIGVTDITANLQANQANKSISGQSVNIRNDGSNLIIA